MAYDFAGISSIVDVGGGQGKLLEKILQFNPYIRGTVFDTASTIERVKRGPGNDAWSRRCSYVTGDFFTSVPQGADAYLLCGVIHDWDDRRAIRILENCWRAMGEKGRVLLVDMVVPDTKAESRALLDAADYKLTRIIPTKAPQSVLEAAPRVCD